MCVSLGTKFEVSSIVLPSFKQGGEGGGVTLPSTTSKQTPKKYTQIWVKQSKDVTSILAIKIDFL